MDVLYRMERATAADVHRGIADPPSYSAVRAMLRVLEEKGHVKHEEKDLRYVYLPIVSREKARKHAVRHLLETFFEGSPEKAVATLLDVSNNLSDEEFDKLAELIEKARREGR